MRFGLRKVLVVGLVPLAIFWVLQKERNRRTFKMMEDEFERVRDRWFQTLCFLVLIHPLYLIEDLGDLIKILTDM